jgi:uncharacterized protein (DUF433 family)
MGTVTGVVSTPNIFHGKPRLEGTRIGVFQLGTLVRQQEWGIDAVAEEFDLDTTAVSVAVDYYDDHPELMETLRAQHESGLQSLREQSHA